MKRLLPVLVFMSSCFGVFSQNYQTVYSDKVANFQDSWSFVYCNKVDSIKIENGDSTFYFMKNLLINTHGDDYTLEASWLGTELDVLANGNNVFYNYADEPVVIKTQAKVNVTWELYSSESKDLKIKATIISNEIESFLTLSDSVKTIELSATDFSGQSISHVLNDYELKISKNFGFVKTVNFYLLNFDLNVNYFGETSLAATEFTNLDLVGLESPEVGLQNLKTSDVYDYDVGDEYHFKTVKNIIFNEFYVEQNITNKIMKIVERHETDSGTTYLSDFEKELIDSEGNHTYSVYSSYVNYGLDERLELYPGQFTFGTDYDYGYDYGRHYSFINDKTPKKVSLNESGWTRKPDGSWYVFLPIRTGGETYSDGFIKGLGGEYYETNFIAISETDSYKLVYYKKGAEEWGNKLVVGINTSQESREVNVSPNPALNYFTIQNNGLEIETIAIYDTRGNFIKSIESTDKIIDVSALGSGVYVLQIQTNNGLHNNRFVKE